MALFSIFRRLFGPRSDTMEPGCPRDRGRPDHPQLLRMSQRELADLQFRPARFLHCGDAAKECGDA